MLRFTLATFLALGALSPGQVVSQELPPNLITGPAPISATARPDGRALLELADQALAAGLSSTAGGFYSQLLADPRLDEKARELAGLGLTAATLERARVPETKAALKFLPKSARKTLREGLLAVLENDLEGAANLSGELKVNELPAHEMAWGHALRWMIAAAKGDNLNATLSQEAIARTAVSEEQRQRIELLGYRATILAGKVEDRTLQVLRELAEEARGTPLAYAYARNLALAYAQRKRPDEAAKALAAAGPLAPARQAEADLLAGLILGAENIAGRERLKEAARNPANVAVRLTALRALVAAATPPEGGSPEKTLEARAVANEVNDFLLRQKPGSLTYHCPRDPQVLDAIHLARAQLMLFAGSREKARQASEDLLKDVPASPLAREATRTLAIAAWGDGSYRLAATHLTTLADSSVEPERAGLRIAAADCLFLAKDFVLAEKAYANLQQEAADIRLSEDAFHQRVLCLLEISDDAAAWDRVATVIEETARTRRTRTGLPLWSASWSLIEDARKSGRAADAEKLLARLRPLLAEARADYALRFVWQSALLAIAQGRLAEAGRLAQEIDRRLDDIPKDDALSELKRSAPELQGHAALLKARTLLNVGSAQGLEELVALRRRFGKIPAAAASYLVEGRHLASVGRHADAQNRFESLARDFQSEPTLAEFASLGLYEAAEQAALQAPTGGEGKLRDAVELLERFTETYPLSPLLTRVTLRRAEILRSLGQFDKALLVLDGLIRERPADAARPQAEMARADALFGLAQLRRDRNGQLDRQRIARASAAYERIAEAWAKDSADTQTEAWYKWALTLTERAKAETGLEAGASRAEARKVLLRVLTALRSDRPGEAAGRFSSEGRLWVARSVLLMGELCEQDGDRAEAIAAYSIIVTINQGLSDGLSRLPGQATAESKLATLRGSSSNPK
jgi:outer membrane protein assembly factor BamD (BamD/ComL family)